MPALANVNLSTIMSDTQLSTSATVGVDKVFQPEGWKPDGVAVWVDRSGGVALGFPRLTFKMRAPTKASPVYKCQTKFFFPVLETVDPATGIFGPKFAYDLEMHLDLLMHERATSAERLAFLSYIRSLMATTITASDGSPTNGVGSPITTFITSLEDVY